jgi:virginiamycin B lyase
VININDVEHVVTAPLSSRILGIDYDDLSNRTVNLYQSSLPYWIKAVDDNTIFTNEHVGNKIAKYSPGDGTLTEYWIPSQNILYSICNPQISTNICGYSNALQFDIQHHIIDNTANNYSRVWFSEQSENKIGYVDLGKKIPVDIAVNPHFINIKNGANNTVKLNMNVLVNLSSLQKEFEYKYSKDKDINLKPILSTSFSPNGNLSGFTALFNPELLKIGINQSIIDSKQEYAVVKLELKFNHEINPGNYNLMIGVESKDFTLLKEVKLKVSE